jgi:amino acid transporter
LRNLIRGLIYKKWFYGFLAVVLWFDCFTDIADFIEVRSPRETISLIMSASGAILVTLIFIDLHLRWPPGKR